MSGHATPTPAPALASCPSPTKPLTVAITGALGLVGSQAAHLLLSHGHSVLALDLFDPSDSRLDAFRDIESERFTYRKVSAVDYAAYRDACKEAGADALVHLAAKFIQHEHGRVWEGQTPQWDIHNTNVAMSYNTLCIAAELGINRVVIASSVNSIGMVFSQNPTFDYLPLDEKHPFRPEDAYSLSKYFCELQSDAFVRLHPRMRIATLRFHWVVPAPQLSAAKLHARRGAWKDLWGFVSVAAAAESILLGLTAPSSTFPEGSHESFFIVAPTICQQTETRGLLAEYFPQLLEGKEGKVGLELRGNQGLFDCSKAHRMLGWHTSGFPMSMDGLDPVVKGENQNRIVSKGDADADADAEKSHALQLQGESGKAVRPGACVQA